MDASRFWEGQLLKELMNEIDSSNVKAIIASGPPFRNVFYASKIKKTHPKITFIADMRDPWLDGNLSSLNFSDNRKGVEKILLQKTLENCNYFLVTDDRIKEIYSNYFDKARHKFRTIKHFYDEDESRFDPKIKTEKTIIIYSGSIVMTNRDSCLDPLLEALKSNQEYLKANKIEFHFYTQSKWLEVETRLLGLPIHFHDPLPPRSLSKEISSKADFLLSLNPTYLKDFLLTKLIDYSTYGIPIIHISEKGKSWEFLNEYNNGFTVRPIDLNDFFSSFQSLNRTLSGTSCPLEFSLSHQTMKLENLVIH